MLFFDILPKATTMPRGMENSSVSPKIATVVSIPPASFESIIP
jgi:hypothetical protein